MFILSSGAGSIRAFVTPQSYISHINKSYVHIFIHKKIFLHQSVHLIESVTSQLMQTYRLVLKGTTTSSCKAQVTPLQENRMTHREVMSPAGHGQQILLPVGL